MKSKNKGRVYPSPSSSSSSLSSNFVPDGDFLSVLKLLPAAILALACALSLEDREVLAYLITRSMKSATPSSTRPKSKKKSSRRTMGGGTCGSGSGHNPPIFGCDCFDCYRSYWFRWDSSVNRELIHQAIEAFEDQLTCGEKSKKSSGRNKRRDRTARRDPENPASIQNQENQESEGSSVITPAPSGERIASSSQFSMGNSEGAETGDASEKEEAAKAAEVVIEEPPEEEDDVSDIVQTSSPNNNKGNNSARKPNFKPFKQLKIDQYHRKTFDGFKTGRVAEEYEKDTTNLISDFHGLLAIGTLGSAEVSSDLMKPKFSLSLDVITEKENEVSENEMTIDEVESEKVLAAESKEDGRNKSSHKNSHASMGRTSHASTINFSSKPTDSRRNSTNGTLVCQIQKYLFGAATEVAETKTEEKETRTSPGVIFQKCKFKNSGAKCNKDKKHADKEVDKSALYMMKKKLKKKILRASSGNLEVAAPGTLDSASAGKKKLQKMLTMFHRKVHPENSITTETLDKPQKKENMTKATHDEICDIKDRTLADEDMMLYSKMAFSN